MDWAGLSLLCAFSLASTDAATKAWLQGYSVRELVVVRFGVVGLLMTPLLVGMPSVLDLPTVFWAWRAVLIPLEIAAMLLYMAAIRDHPLSLTLPYLAFTPVFVIAVAWVLLGEEVSPLGAAGVGLVVAGAWMINSRHAERGDWRSWTRPFAAIVEEPGSRMMPAVAAIYAVTATLGKGAMRHMDPKFFGAFYFALPGAAVSLLFVLPRPRLLLKLARRPGPVLVVGVLMGLMVYTHF
jgi:drug/metabolite transporter (DMT)-like permease